MAYVTPGTVAAGDVATAAAWNVLVGNDVAFSPLAAAWVSYTPTLAQGASTNISKTINTAKYLRVGTLLFVSIYFSVTGTGTANNAITVSVPSGFTMPGQFFLVGQAQYNDASVQRYPAAPYYQSSTTVSMRRTDQAPGDDIGRDPNIAVASGDEVFMSFACEVNP